MGKLHAGLDVADLTTAICVVDDSGQIVLETVAETTPEAIAEALKPFRRSLKNVGQESGLKAAWLHRELARAKFPMLCLDAYKAHKLLGTRINKTDTNDAHGLALLLAKDIYYTAYLKSEDAIRIRVALSMRTALLRRANDLGRAAKSARKQLGATKQTRRRQRPTDAQKAAERALLEIDQASAALKLTHRTLDKTVTALAHENDVCRRLMTIPGVGPIAALTYYAAVDDPRRFKSSRNVAVYFGLTPRVFQTGQSVWSGAISHRGDPTVRRALVSAARALIVNSKSSCSLRRWGRAMAGRKGYMFAYVAVARKLAVLMHHLWITGEDFDPAR